MSKVALVTGASRGIGRAIALGLAQDGFDLSVCARNQKDLETLQQQASKLCASTDYSKAPKVAIHPMDVRDCKAVAKMVTDTVEQFGRIDVLFNNAGIFRPGTSEISLEDFNEMLDINLRAAFNFVQHVAPVMKRQNSGHIINLSSRSGKLAKPLSGGYAASKFGLVGLSEALYRELSDDGISVTAICPGWVDTEMADMSGLSTSEKMTTDDILNTVRWLLSLSPAARVKDVYMESVRQVTEL